MTLGVLLVSLCFRRVQTSETQQDLLMILVPVMLLGTVLLHLGAGVMADGWRSLKDEFDAAPLFGWSPRYALLRRLPWPCAAGALTLASAFSWPAPSPGGRSLERLRPRRAVQLCAAQLCPAGHRAVRPVHAVHA